MKGVAKINLFKLNKAPPLNRKTVKVIPPKYAKDKITSFGINIDFINFTRRIYKTKQKPEINPKINATPSNLAIILPPQEDNGK